MKDKFLVQTAIGAVVYAVIVALAHVVSGVPANWLIDLSGLAAFVIGLIASRAIVSL